MIEIQVTGFMIGLIFGFVRCIECKWYEGDVMANPWGVCCHPSWVDGNSGHEVAERGWCYRAERREE